MRPGPIAKRKLRAGVFKQPRGTVWCICYYVNRRPRWQEIGTRAEALRAYRDLKRRTIEKIEKTKHERHVSFPKPFRAGPFEHPPRSGVWWIGYYDKESRPRDRAANRGDQSQHRRRVKIGSREDAIKAYESRCAEVARRHHDVLWGTDEKKKKTGAAISAANSTPAHKLQKSENAKAEWARLGRDPQAYLEFASKRKTAQRQPEIRQKRRESALGNLRLIEANGLPKATKAAADPQVRARSLATKMRKHLFLIGVVLTEKQSNDLIESLLLEILDRRALARARKKQSGKSIDPIYWAALLEMERDNHTLRQVTEKHLSSYYARDQDGAINQMKSGVRRARASRAA